MITTLQIENFVAKHVVQREKSFFQVDFHKNAGKIRKEIQGKRVLVIGGAGTVGASFVKALVAFGPRSLVVVDNHSAALSELGSDLQCLEGVDLPDDLQLYPIDYGSLAFQKLYLRQGVFDLVANFAPHADVNPGSDIFGIEAMLENKVFKTKRLLDLMTLRAPKKFFCASTLWANRPEDIAGASDKLMEEVILSYGDRFKITLARLSEIAFANGSVLEGMINRISKNQFLSCPLGGQESFITHEEAAQLCLLSVALGKNTEIFVPLQQNKSGVSYENITENLVKSLGLDIKSCSSAKEAKLAMKNISEEYPVHFQLGNSYKAPSFDESADVQKVNAKGSYGVISINAASDRKKVESIIFQIRELFDFPHVDKNDLVNLLALHMEAFNPREGKPLNERI
jgi:hypothetical protein